jgi:hypothetical protein
MILTISIILNIILLFCLFIQWTKRNVYHDPTSGTVINHDKFKEDIGLEDFYDEFCICHIDCEKAKKRVEVMNEIKKEE